MSKTYVQKHQYNSFLYTGESQDKESPLQILIEKDAV